MQSIAVMKLITWLLFTILVVVTAAPTENEDENPMLTGGDFEGDILLPKGRSVSDFMKSGVKNTRYRWSQKTVIYQLDPAFTVSEKSVIISAMTEISSETCVKFVQRTTEVDYVYVVRGGAGTGCGSYVGRLGGKQQLNLEPGCFNIGIIEHELMHTIGFHHEQSRSDRDRYVTINWNNIKKGYQSNFNKYEAGVISDFGVPYDYQSVMHYGAFDFATNSKSPTIKVPQGVRIGQRKGLSGKDATRINQMYNC